MSDKQRRVAHFQAQPEGLGLFFHPAALSFTHLARLNLAHSALLGKKTAPAESIGLVLTGPKECINHFAFCEPTGMILNCKPSPALMVYTDEN
ncbi:MAG: hypothetical protein JAZ02_05425 [Candidatus Thiodiazotropha endolucinida]|nr:hypothetical protein [Candidatus Thiodiazotropha endolucinida]